MHETADTAQITPHPWQHPRRVATLKRARPTPFDLTADPVECAAIADFLGLDAIAELRFKGDLSPDGEHGWLLRGRLTANLTQKCVVTLEPVPARIDENVERRFVPDLSTVEIDIDPEAEDDPDEFQDQIDPGAVALEELALALDPYPRKPDTTPVEARATPPGADPLDDEALKPFAGLAALRDKMQNNG